MNITNFEAPGLEKIDKYLEKSEIMFLSRPSAGELLKNINISFVLEGIDRLQSTLICEMKDSYVQQSQRYVALGSEAYLLPDLEPDDLETAQELVAQAFSLYSRMSVLKDLNASGRPKKEDYQYGIPIEDARYILPLCTKTNISVAMSGNKIINLFGLFGEQKYGDLFLEIKEQLLNYLPKHLRALVVGARFEYPNFDLVQEFYQPYLSRLNEKDNLILLNHFGDLNIKSGIGALTSTSAEPSSTIMAQWGDAASEKASAVTKRVLGYGHTSIAEQARTTFGMMCSLVTYHQQLRHRLSQNYREELNLLIEDSARAVKLPPSIADSAFAEEFKDLAQRFKIFRREILARYGLSKAAKFLLNCDQIKLTISANARADAMMLSDRTCMNAQWEIRDLACKKLKILRDLSDILYEKALPSCVLGKCREGKLSCGQGEFVRKMFLEKG